MVSVRQLTATFFLQYCFLFAPAFLQGRSDITGGTQYMRFPLVFEPHATKVNGFVSNIFVSPRDGVRIDIDSSGVAVHLPDARVTVAFEHAQHRTALPGNKLTSYSNYLLGNDPSKWRTEVPHYSRVRYPGIYKGIDVVYYGNNGQIEYDFVVAPGANPHMIELAAKGADALSINSDGSLAISAGHALIRQTKPFAYQTTANGVQQQVPCRYRLANDGTVQFDLGAYDRTRPLIIDPVLQFSQYLGGSGYEVGVSLTSDASGAIYLAGQTNSSSLPASRGLQTGIGGASDAIVAKFLPGGETLQWLTYFGGKEPEIASSVDVDSAGNVIIAGFTASSNLPTSNAFQSTLGGGLDAFVAKLNASGTGLVYSTYLGGALDDSAIGVTVDSTGAAYASGWTRSSDFPTIRSFQSSPSGGGRDVFVTKFAANGSPVYSTYVGGDGEDFGTGIAVDVRGNAYVTGGSTSTYFANAATQNAGDQDTFVFKLSPTGQSVDYLLFRGGRSEDLAYSIAVDAAGSAFVSGYTRSADFPVTARALQASLSGPSDLFVYKLNPDGTAADYSTFLGGAADESGFGNIRLDAAGTVYVTGWTASRNFPLRNAAQATFGGGRFDAFVSRLAPGGDSLLYSTFVGGGGDENAYGLALDNQSNVVICGWTSSPDLPVATGALNRGSLEIRDLFLARLSPDTAVTLLGASPSSLRFSARSGQAGAPQTIALSSTGQPVSFAAGASVPWLSVTSSASITPAVITIGLSNSYIATAAPGVVAGEITINAPSAGNAPIRIPVTLAVEAVPAIASIAPNAIDRSVQNTPVTITGSGFTAGASVTLNGAPLAVTYVNPTTLQTIIPAILLPAGSSASLVVQTALGASSPFVLPILSGVPVISASSVVNAASQQGGQVSPGLLVTIYGSNIGPEQPAQGVADSSGIFPSVLGETRILFDGVPGAVTDSRSTQVSAIVPFGIAGRDRVNLQVEYRGQRSGVVSIPVVQATPALFTALATGTGPVAAINDTYVPVSLAAPAPRGSVVMLYGTGFGQFTPTVVDGRVAGTLLSDLPALNLPVTVTIGGVRAEVLYAGAAPGLLFGISQVNVRIPMDVLPGDSLPVVISAGATASRDAVTIAVR